MIQLRKRMGEQLQLPDTTNNNILSAFLLRHDLRVLAVSVAHTKAAFSEMRLVLLLRLPSPVFAFAFDRLVVVSWPKIVFVRDFKYAN